jgi:hypothetical protein
VNLLCPRADGTGQATDLLIRIEREDIAFSALEDSSEGVLKEREASHAAACVGDEPANEVRFDCDIDDTGRPDDRGPQFIARERVDRDRRTLHQ